MLAPLSNADQAEMRLTLFRHAKSSWVNPGLADHDRPLSKRGERDAPMMGARLRARHARPTAILSSIADRALTTAQWIAEALSFPLDDVRTDRRLYLAGAPQILQIVMEQSRDSPELIVVGHNPGFTDLANQLLPALRLDNLPTAGCVAMEFRASRWSELAEAEAALLYLDYPKNPDSLTVDV